MKAKEKLKHPGIISILRISLLAIFLIPGVINTFNVSANKFVTTKSIMMDSDNTYYLVDGVPMTAKEVDKLDSEDIESMEIIKDKERIKQLTDEDVDIVVIIKMKKAETQ